MKKPAIVAHAIEQAIADFGRNFSAGTDFSLPTAQKALFSAQTGLFRQNFPIIFQCFTATHF